MRLLVPLASGLDQQGSWVFSRLFHPWSTITHLAWPLANLHEAIDSSSVLGLIRSPDYTPAFHKAIVILCATWEIKSTTFTPRHPGMLLLSIVFFILVLIYFLYVCVGGVHAMMDMWNQRTTSWSRLTPSTLAWLPGLKSGFWACTVTAFTQ